MFNKLHLHLFAITTLLSACQLDILSGTGGSVSLGPENPKPCSSNCIVDMAMVSNETLTAIPEPGYEFDRWEGAAFCVDPLASVCELINIPVLGVPLFDDQLLELKAIFSGEGLGLWGNSDGPEINAVNGKCCILREDLTAANVNTDATLPLDVRMASDGSVLAVWMQEGLWVNHYNPLMGWQGAVALREGVGSYGPSVDVHPDGSAVVVWAVTYPNDEAGTWAQMHTPSDGWLAAEKISGAFPSGLDTAVAMDAEGNVMAAWMQRDKQKIGAVYDVWASYYVAGVGWENPKAIESSSVNYEAIKTGARLLLGPKIAMTPTGEAVVVWPRATGTGLVADIWSNRFTRDNGWSGPEIIESLPGFSSRPELSVDGNGRVTVVWAYDSDTSTSGFRPEHIYAVQYREGDGWGSTLRLSGDDVIQPGQAHVDSNSNGEAMAVWTQYIDFGTPTQDRVVHASRYSSIEGWGKSELAHGRRIPRTSFWPRVSYNDNGVATVVWAQTVGYSYKSGMIGIANFTAAAGWQQDFSLDESTFAVYSAYRHQYPRLAMNEDSTVVVWLRETGRRSGEAVGPITVQAMHRR